MRINQQALFVGLFLVTVSLCRAETDFLSFMAPGLGDQPSYEIKPWTVFIGDRIRFGQTHDSYDNHESKSALFNKAGSWDLVHLGLGLNDADRDNPLKPATRAKWGAPAAPFSGLNNLAADDGKADVSGTLKILDMRHTVALTLPLGFFVDAALPVRQITTEGVIITPKGALVINGVAINTYLTNDLPLIAKEHGVELNLARTTKVGLGDLAVAGGWQGAHDNKSTIFTYLKGLFKAGALFPTAHGQNKDLLISFPFGYNGHYGFFGRGAVEVTIFDAFTVGATVGSTVFLKKTQEMRVNTNPDQNGFLKLQKTRVREDLGSLINLAGYIKADKIVRGFNLLLGYSFTQQEATLLEARSDDYLRDFTAAQLANLQAGGARTPLSFISRSEVLNSDPALRAWQQQVLHAGMSVDTQVLTGGKLGAVLGLEYAYPVMGKRVYATGMFGGSAAFKMIFNF